MNAEEKRSIPRFFYGAVIIAAGFFIQAVVVGIANSFGIFFDPFIREFGWSRAGISGAVSIGFLIYGISSIVLGNLNDRVGPRLIMSCCGLLLGAGYFLLGTIHSLWHLYIYYCMIVALGMGGADVIVLSCVSRWYHRKRGMMSGLVKVGTGVGMLVMPFVIHWLIEDYGWRTAFNVLAAVLVICVLFLAQFLVRDPGLKGQQPDNGRSKNVPDNGGAEEGLSFKQAVRTRQLWTLCLIYLIILFCVYIILMHIVQHAIDLGIDSASAAGILSTVGASSILGRLLMGGAGDRIGEKPGLLICLAGLFVSMCWLQAVSALWMFYLFAVIYGFAHGGFFALVSPLVAAFFGMRSHGLLLGIVIFSSTLGGAAGPVMAGYMFDVWASYKAVFLILSAASAAAVGLAMSLKPVEHSG